MTDRTPSTETLEEVISGVNSGEILEATFEIVGYGHYSHCVIRRIYRKLDWTDIPSFEGIEVVLTKDHSEYCRFPREFQDVHKILHIPGRGKCRLQDVKDKIRFLDIVYAEDPH